MAYVSTGFESHDYKMGGQRSDDSKLLSVPVSFVGAKHCYSDKSNPKTKSIRTTEAVVAKDRQKILPVVNPD